MSVWKRSSANGAISSGRLARRDQLGERDADDRRRLEAVRAPAARDQETVHIGHAEDRAVVGAQVAQPGPLAQDLRALELREQLERVPRRVLEERERARAEVRRVRLDLGADQELAAIGLGDVDVHLRRDDDHVEERLQRLGHERLQDVRRDRQRNAGEVGDQRRPARGGIDHRPGLDVAPVRLHAGDAAVRPLDARHLGVGVDLDTAAVGRTSEPPDDGVVADDPAGRVVERAQDRPGDVAADVDLRAEPLDLRRVDHAAVDAEQLVHLGPLGHRDHGAVGVRERQVPVLREHQVEVELGAEPLVELDAAAVERRRPRACGSSRG